LLEVKYNANFCTTPAKATTFVGMKQEDQSMNNPGEVDNFCDY